MDVLRRYPGFLELDSAVAYRDRFEAIYCRGPIETHDGIRVRFRKQDFNHAFFESSRRNNEKDIFSNERAMRMMWIREALRDPSAEMYVGWDKKKKRYDSRRRVTIVLGDFVVVISITGDGKTANFVTCYNVQDGSLSKIRQGPRWR